MTVSAVTSPTFQGKFLRWFPLFLASLLLLCVSLWIASSLVVLSIAIGGVSIYMMHRWVGLFNLTKLNISCLFYWLYLVVILTPGFFIYNDEFTAARKAFLFGIESVLITVPTGIFLANRFFKFTKEEITKYFRSEVDSSPPTSLQSKLYLAILVLGVLLIVANILETPQIPLLYLLRNPGEAIAAAVLREESFKLLNSPFLYAYAVFRSVVFPFLIMVALGRYWIRKNRFWRWLFWSSLICGVGYAALTIEKSPVATIVLLLFLFYYLFNGGKVGKFAAIAAPVLFLSFPAMVILLAYEGGSETGGFGAVFQAIGTRLFYTPAQVLYAYFEIFPKAFPFQYGASSGKIAELMGLKALNIPNVVALYMNQGTAGIESATANACFIGNLNADFGLPGVVIGGIIAGVCMQMVTIYFFRRPKTIVNIAAYAVCMWSFGLLVTSPLPTMLLSGGVTFAILLAWVLGFGAFRQPLVAV
jgi:oligosaccharide repeat unit polymerase